MGSAAGRLAEIALTALPSVVGSASSRNNNLCASTCMQACQPAAAQQRMARLVAKATVDDLEIQELVVKLDEMVR